MSHWMLSWRGTWQAVAVWIAIAVMSDAIGRRPTWLDVAALAVLAVAFAIRWESEQG